MINILSLSLYLYTYLLPGSLFSFPFTVSFPYLCLKWRGQICCWWASSASLLRKSNAKALFLKTIWSENESSSHENLHPQTIQEKSFSFHFQIALTKFKSYNTRKKFIVKLSSTRKKAKVKNCYVVWQSTEIGYGNERWMCFFLFWLSAYRWTKTHRKLKKAMSKIDWEKERWWPEISILWWVDDKELIDWYPDLKIPRRHQKLKLFLFKLCYLPLNQPYISHHSLVSPS